MTAAAPSPESGRIAARAATGSFLAVAAAALVIQAAPAWREVLIYDRARIAAGELWRLWTGHLVHFGWPHCAADTGLLLVLGFVLRRRHACFGLGALVAMPPAVSAVLYGFAPDLARYGGLSALDLGLLLYVALQGWQRDWTDWFWPAVLLIYAGEIIFELVQGGRGGGMIRFDDPTIRVATGAHLASAAYAVAAWLATRRRNGGRINPR